MLKAGIMVSYAVDFDEIYRRSAVYVDWIVRGANPADLPVEFPTKLHLGINLKTAKVLGIVVPNSVLLRADRVIE